MSTRDGVLVALGSVRDPELDEPITALGFVRRCELSADGDVAVALRLPTPQCAPNFAFLMAADAREAVRRLPGVRSVRVVLEDHYTGEEINRAVQRELGFSGAFPGEGAADDLGALRSLFQRKALLARQAGLCEGLLASGLSLAELCALRVCELPVDPVAARCLELRRQLGLACSPDSPAFVRPDGSPLQAGALERWLRMARLVRTSLEVNGGICRSLLAFRLGRESEDPEEVLR